MTELNGVLPIDKPEGPTSHDIVARARRALRTRRVGHTGTLDPFASGLLLLCLGPATRLAEYLTALPKRYRAVLRLGAATDTDDLAGRVVSESERWVEVAADDLRAALARQTGAIDQVPPAYSAKKVEGERMYDVARRGGTVELPPVRVTVYSAELLSFDPPDATFEVECSAGTYIRAIARDVGAELGVGGHLRSLRRTRVGGFRIEQAIPLEAMDDAEAVRAALVPPSRAVPHLAAITVDERGLAAMRYGQAIEAPEGAPAGEPLAVYGPDGALVAIAERSADAVRPRKVFA